MYSRLLDHCLDLNKSEVVGKGVRLLLAKVVKSATTNVKYQDKIES